MNDTRSAPKRHLAAWVTRHVLSQPWQVGVRISDNTADNFYLSPTEARMLAAELLTSASRADGQPDALDVERDRMMNEIDTLRSKLLALEAE